MVDKGWTVVFSQSGNYALHEASGRRINFTKRRNVFEFDLEVDSSSPFQRHADQQ